MANTLLVLGNGFDLNCSLESSFEQYMNSEFYEPSLNLVRKAYDNVRNRLGRTEGREFWNQQTFFQIFENELLSFWDFCFSIPHFCNFYDIKLWHDFETKLHEFVDSGRKERGILSSIKSMNWTEADRKYRYSPKEADLIVHKLVLHEYLTYKKEAEGNLELFLLRELKQFEAKFGEYICRQQANSPTYKTRANALIERLLGQDESGKKHKLTYINTFNYTDIKNVGYGEEANMDYAVWHVNGNSTHPIFGIDLSEAEPANSKWYAFTKTYRRLELEGSEEYYPANKKTNRVVIYGHSLTKQDYSFFYALFNRLNLGEGHRLQNGTSICFAYSGYTGKTAEEARHDTIESVIRLLQSYSKDVLDEKTFHLMDILHCNGIVSFVEIPST